MAFSLIFLFRNITMTTRNVFCYLGRGISKNPSQLSIFALNDRLCFKNSNNFNLESDTFVKN